MLGVGGGDCCGAGVDAEFLVDVVEVAANRVGRDEEVFGDLAVCETSGDVSDNVVFATGEVVGVDALLPAVAESCEVRPEGRSIARSRSSKSLPGPRVKSNSQVMPGGAGRKIFSSCSIPEGRITSWK